MIVKMVGRDRMDRLLVLSAFLGCSALGSLNPAPLAAQAASPEPATTQATTGDAAPTPPAGQGTMAQATTTEQDLQDLRARQAFSIGREMYSAGRFSEAATEFQTAYDLSHRSQLLYNLYIAYRDSQQTARAAAVLRQYLAEVPDDPRRPQLEAGLAALDGQLALQQETEAARAQAEQARAEADALRAEEEARRRLAEADAARARARTRPWWPWVLTGVGVAAGGVGVAMVAITGNDIASLENQCAVVGTVRTCNPSVDIATRRSSLQSQALITDILWIGGAAMTATGLFLAFALPDEIPAQTTVACSFGYCSVEGSF